MRINIDGQQYIISERKSPGNKPKLFMLRLTGKARQYVSSLFPTDRLNVYRFEENEVWYCLDLNNHTIRLIIDNPLV
jgi:hypothetical protein